MNISWPLPLAWARRCRRTAGVVAHFQPTQRPEREFVQPRTCLAVWYIGEPWKTGPPANAGCPENSATLAGGTITGGGAAGAAPAGAETSCSFFLFSSSHCFRSASVGGGTPQRRSVRSTAARRLVAHTSSALTNS